MQTVLKSFLSTTLIWLLTFVVASAVMIIPLSAAQTQDKGFVVKGSRDIDQSAAAVRGTRWALLVGIASYPSVGGFEIQKLKAPVKDVNAIEEFLKDPQRGGFDPDYVFKLTDDQATKRNILMTFNDIANRAAPEDMVLFYFSGHGAPAGDGESTYLIPYDHDLRDVETTCINFYELSRKIRRMEANKVIVVLDACHSGGIKAKDAKSGLSKGLTDGYVKAFQESFQGSEGKALLLSSDESEVSWEDEEGGIFTRFLLEGLDGKADKDDNGIVTFMEAALYVENTVRKYTSENFPRPQTPAHRHLADIERGDIPLALAINWDKLARQRQHDLWNKRNEAIYRASLAGLDQAFKEFSLQVAKSAYNKALSDVELTERESLLLQEIDALKEGIITTADYVARVPAIYNIGLVQLQVAVIPADAKVTLKPASAPDSVIPPSSRNVYKVEKGRYLLSAERRGYAPYSREIALVQGSKAEKVELERLMGTLQVQVEPADAMIMVTPLSVEAPDTEIKTGRSLRIRPADERDLPIGTYRVTAEKEGHERATKEPVEIRANAPSQVTLTLKLMKSIKPESATIIASDLPDNTRVIVNGQLVRLPYKLPPGTHKIQLERDGFQTVEMSEVLKSAQILNLRPEWNPIEILKPSVTPRGIPRVGAFAASLVVPGLGQHLQRHHLRGAFYEVMTIGAGAAVLWTVMNYQGKLDDYEDVQERLELTIRQRKELTPGIGDLFDEQKEAHDEAESARTLAIAAQIALGVVWGINALDAGIVKPAQQSSGIAFQAYLTSDGVQFLVRAPFRMTL